MNRVLFISVILLIYIIYIAIKQKAIWSRLSLFQNIGVLITFITVMAIGGMTLFYGARSITTFMTNEIVTTILHFLITILIVIICTLLFNVLVRKITNGILPLKRKR